MSVGLDVADAGISGKPFPFLRLPKDIRFMIYELLQPNTNKHVRFSNAPERDTKSAVLVIRSMNMSILRTCKTINDEACGLLYKTARQLFTKCAAQIVLPKGDTQENMVTTFLGALGPIPHPKPTYFGLTNPLLIHHANRTAYLLWAGPSFTIHIVPVRRTREDFWKMSKSAWRIMGGKWDKTMAMTSRNITAKVKAWVGPFEWTIEVAGVLPLATRNMPFDNSLDNILKHRKIAPRAYGMDEGEWIKDWMAVELKKSVNKKDTQDLAVPVEAESIRLRWADMLEG